MTDQGCYNKLVYITDHNAREKAFLMTNHDDLSNLNQMTKRAVRAFWMDGLWDLASVGALILIGVWGMFYVQFTAFPVSVWPFLSQLGRNAIWLGLLGLAIGLAIYFWFAWIVVNKLKRLWISPYVGHAQHRFIQPVKPKSICGISSCICQELDYCMGCLPGQREGLIS